jgi:hypothetical protein
LPFERTALPILPPAGSQIINPLRCHAFGLNPAGIDQDSGANIDLAAIEAM